MALIMFQNFIFIGLSILSLTASAAGTNNSTSSGSIDMSEMPIIYFPTKLSFWNSSQGGQIERQVHIKQNDGHPLLIKDVKITGDFLTAALDKESQGNNKMQAITITLKGGRLPGSISETLTVVTNHPEQPIIELPIYGNVLNGIVLDPQAFGVRLNYFKRQATGMIKISSTRSEKFEIKGISSSFPGMKAALVEGDDCCSHIIAVAISDTDKKILKPTRATLHVDTTSKQGLIVIPVLIDVPSM